MQYRLSAQQVRTSAPPKSRRQGVFISKYDYNVGTLPKIVSSCSSGTPVFSSSKCPLQYVCSADVRECTSRCVSGRRGRSTTKSHSSSSSSSVLLHPRACHQHVLPKEPESANTPCTLCIPHFLQFLIANKHSSCDFGAHSHLQFFSKEQQ